MIASLLTLQKSAPLMLKLIHRCCKNHRLPLIASQLTLQKSAPLTLKLIHRCCKNHRLPLIASQLTLQKSAPLMLTTSPPMLKKSPPLRWQLLYWTRLLKLCMLVVPVGPMLDHRRVWVFFGSSRRAGNYWTPQAHQNSTVWSAKHWRLIIRTRKFCYTCIVHTGYMLSLALM